METNTENTAAPSVDVPRLVRRWRVRGICFVPCDLELEIEAETEEEAIREALTYPWQQSLCGNCMDFGAAFDWEPSAEEINPANSKAQEGASLS